MGLPVGAGALRGAGEGEDAYDIVFLGGSAMSG